MQSDISSTPRRSAGFVARSLATTGTRLLDLPSRYGLHLLIAARLSIADVGAFYIVFSVMTLVAGFGRLGVDRALTREVAGALGRNAPATARAAVRRAFVVTAAQSVLVAGLLAAAAIPVAGLVLHKPWLAIPFLLGALTIVPQNLSTTAAGALAGLGRVASSQMIYSWLWPALFCGVALVLPLTVARTLLLIGGSLLLNALVGIGLMFSALPKVPNDAEKARPGPYFRIGISFFSLELIQLAMASAPPFVLGMVASTAEVGRYALAWRIVLVLNILVSAMAAIASPQFARFYAVNDRRELQRSAAQAVGLTVGLSLVPLLLLAIKPVFFLGLFGRGYDAAATTLRILLAGQAALVLCTAMPELLGMAGCARVLFKINTAALATLMVSLALLTPRFGAIGAATATAATMLLNAVAVTFAVKRHLGFVPLVSVYKETRSRVA
jgi:O-antigen/teichoic acid export membrane protein